MGDLHSIAYSTNIHSCPSLGWDFDVFNTDIISPFMESTPPFQSNLETELSSGSGYLQDALFKFNSKRRRLFLFDDHDNYHTKDSNNSIKDFWSSTIDHHFAEDYDSFGHIMKCDSFSGEDPMSRSLSKMTSEDNSNITDVKVRADEEANSAYYSSPSSNQISSVNISHKQALQFAIGVGDEKRSKKRMGSGVGLGKVVYPFGLVKPGGHEGDVTLDDINERILMRPTRPVRHPVGDFACRPTVSPTGPGLSGKTVVALTKIHTQGRGTITIIRTRG